MVPELLHAAGFGEFGWTVYLLTFAWEEVGRRPTSAAAAASVMAARARGRRVVPIVVITATPSLRRDGAAGSRSRRWLQRAPWARLTETEGAAAARRSRPSHRRTGLTVWNPAAPYAL